MRRTSIEDVVVGRSASFFILLFSLGTQLLFSGESSADEASPEWSPRLKAWTSQVFNTVAGQPSRFAQNSLSLNPIATVQYGRLGGTSDVRLDAFANSRMDHPGTYRNEFLVREFYGEYSDGATTLRLGQQIVPWGKSDGVNPTDYFTAKDFVYLTPIDEQRRLGGLTASLRQVIGASDSPWVLDAVVMASTPKQRYLIPSDLEARAGVPILREPRTMSLDFDRPAVGARVSYLGSDVDVSVSMFDGYSVWPQFDVVGIGGAATLVPRYVRARAVGTDGSFGIGQDWVVRWESAYWWTDQRAATVGERVFVPPRLESVVGVERPLWTDVRMQVQILHRYFFGWDSRVLSDPLAPLQEFNRTLLNAQDPSVLGATVRLSWDDPESGWGADAMMYGYFTAQNFLLRPSVYHRLTDQVKVSVIADLYRGAPNQPLGALRPLSSVGVHGEFSL